VPGAIRAAEHIIPAILQVVGPVGSVLDLGGGTGAWLQVFRRHGVGKIQLVDHPSAAVDLLVEKEFFRPCDFGSEMPALARFDLAVCVECAEHLPAERADALIACLTAASDAVVFSAAIPGQKGKGHINERWPSYWKDLFARHGFERHDVLRPRILHQADVPWWYRQNLYLFTRAGTMTNIAGDFLPDDFELVHNTVVQAPLRDMVKLLTPKLLRAFGKRVGLKHLGSDNDA